MKVETIFINQKEVEAKKVEGRIAKEDYIQASMLFLNNGWKVAIFLRVVFDAFIHDAVFRKNIEKKYNSYIKKHNFSKER